MESERFSELIRKITEVGTEPEERLQAKIELREAGHGDAVIRATKIGIRNIKKAVSEQIGEFQTARIAGVIKQLVKDIKNANQ